MVDDLAVSFAESADSLSIELHARDVRRLRRRRADKNFGAPSARHRRAGLFAQCLLILIILLQLDRA